MPNKYAIKKPRSQGEQIADLLRDRQVPTGNSLSGTQGAEVATPTVTSSGSPDLASNISSGAQLLGAAGGDNSSPAMGALSGASAGASLGGPMGAIGGGAIGIIGTIAANKAKKKALARQIEAEKFKAIGNIQQQAGNAQAAGIQNMIAGLRSAFLG